MTFIKKLSKQIQATPFFFLFRALYKEVPSVYNLVQHLLLYKLLQNISSPNLFRNLARNKPRLVLFTLLRSVIHYSALLCPYFICWLRSLVIDKSNSVLGLLVAYLLLINKKKFTVVLQDKYDIKDIRRIAFPRPILKVRNVKVVQECLQPGLRLKFNESFYSKPKVNIGYEVKNNFKKLL